MTKKHMILLIVFILLVAIAVNVIMMLTDSPTIMAPDQNNAPIVYDVS